jgi:transposase-like protein
MPGRRPSDIDGLRERERIAVDLLARGKTCRETARALGISERCLYSWRKKPAVQRAIFFQQQEIIDSGQGQGLNVMPLAIQTLTRIMNSDEARDADRINASRALLNGATAFQERKLLERTISDLESQIYGMAKATNAQPTDDPPSVEEDLMAFLPSANPEDSDDA